MASAWWYPDPADPLSRPRWEPVDLVASKMSEVILMRTDGGLKRILRSGPMIVQVGESEVAIVEGQCRYVRLSRSEQEAVIR